MQQLLLHTTKVHTQWLHMCKHTNTCDDPIGHPSHNSLPDCGRGHYCIECPLTTSNKMIHCKMGQHNSLAYIPLHLGRSK